MEIKEVYVERVFNLGNYETLRIGLRANVSEEEVDDVQTLLRNLEDEAIAYRDSQIC